MTTAQTFTTALSSDGWRVLNENGETLALVPDTDTYGKWVAETLANLMSGRDAACAGWQAADAALKRLTANGGQVLIDEFTIEHVPADEITGNPLATHGGNIVATLAQLEQAQAASAAKG